MERTGSAQQLLGTARRALVPESLEELYQALEGVVGEAELVRGVDVARALGIVGEGMRTGGAGGAGAVRVVEVVEVEWRERKGWWEELVAVVGEAVEEARECGEWGQCLVTALRVWWRVVVKEAG